MWPRMNSEIKDGVTTCVPCQTAKVQRLNKAPIKTFLAPDDRFSHIHIDLIDPLNYVSTIVDRFTRWYEATVFLFVTLKPKPSLMHFLCAWLLVLVALQS